MAQSGFVKVADVGELAAGDVKVVEVGSDQILLVNVDGTIYALDDICSHAYASLSEGDLAGEEIECPLHGSAFNVITGEALTPPADENIRTFEVRIDGQDVLLGPAKS
ncbi:MAG: non-heme iron oxygenase ferredoxin subunit [Chloroflexi bacterium]|nr:non-heme iron oxygenase ferredoxin subunit [Chloroflexota bacterium]MCH8226394.1 non-heme iron oxygenase ferredoxin subunit [Chloroflexota bacterium]